ncbi:hypothetical protein J6590_017882 [Homalodisca vitripennis]|nr:hypothetical protein J6590_017882 [Homalodisca vitripennis]
MPWVADKIKTSSGLLHPRPPTPLLLTYSINTRFCRFAMWAIVHSSNVESEGPPTTAVTCDRPVHMRSTQARELGAFIL